MNKIPMSGADISAREIEAVQKVLRSPYLSIGPQIAQFEEEFARCVGTRFAVGVSSGTAGLHLAVIAAGVSEGDYVITTPFSFVASSNVVLYERATPVFVDIDPRTMNIDPNQVDSTIQARRARGDRVKAILPVHVFGQPADLDALAEIAQRYDVPLIEDACEAIGAQYKRRSAGTFGTSAVFAFYPNKQMTTGEGGMIVTNEEAAFHLFRSLRNQGRDDDGTWLRHVRLGYSYRLDEMSAALGLAQLQRIDELLAKRESVAQKYSARLSKIEGVQIPYLAPETTRMSWFVYVIRFSPGIDRDGVMSKLEARGIPARPYFAPIHLQPFYRERFGFREGDFPITEQVGQSTLALPFHANLSVSEINRVVESLAEILGQAI